MVRYNPITGEVMPSYQTHAGHLQRGEAVGDGDGEVEEVAPSASDSTTLPSVDKKQEDKSTGLSITTFEDMVAAEMERLRLEHGQDGGAVKAKKVDDVGLRVAPAASTIAPPSVGSSHHQQQQHRQQQRQQMASSQSSTTSSPHNGRFVSTSLLGRDEGQELATKRQRAREYGEQLRLQMEQDRLAKMSRTRKADASRDVDVDGVSPASASITTAKATDAAVGGASYGELLRMQMKEDEERRRKQREDNRSGSVAEASSIDTIGNVTDSIALHVSKEQKAVEYRRQLDEQIAAKPTSHSRRASKSGVTDGKEVVDGQLDTKSNQAATSDRKKKDEYARQLREQMNAKAARRQRSDSAQAPESSPNASSILSPWHLGEEWEAQERQQRRNAALEQLRLLELQIREQNEAKAKLKKEEEDVEARDADSFKSRYSALPSQATDEVAVAPIEEPTHPSDTTDDCPLLAAESTFIPTPKPKLRRKANECTAISQNNDSICSMKSPVIRRGKGGEAFTVTLNDASDGANSGVTSMGSPTIPSCASGLPTDVKATNSSPCRRARSRSTSATASSIRRPPLEPPVSPTEGTQDTVVDEDDVLVQDILRSALRRIEDNVPNDDEDRREKDSDGLPEKKKSVQFRASETSAPDQNGIPSVPIKERDAYLPNGSDDYVDEDPFQVGDQDRELVVPPTSTQKEFEEDNFDHESLLDDHFDLDKHFDDDEEAEEEKLMQALSRIRNSMDMSFAST